MIIQTDLQHLQSPLWLFKRCIEDWLSYCT